MKVLVIGSGGREHSLVRACLRSPLASTVMAAPGNGGMAQEVRCFPVDLGEVDNIVACAKQCAANFVVIGPENPLRDGVIDALQEQGIPAFGPNREAARLEGSKAFAKQLMEKYGIPTAKAGVFDDLKLSIAHLDTVSFPVVIKASGLAAGKGVIIVETPAVAVTTIEGMLSGASFGDAGKRVLIEEYMTGEEASITLLVSGRHFVALPPSQDHKRIGEGDTGLNTGGMGAYAPAAVVSDRINRQVITQIVEPLLAALENEGIHYAGVLYVGIMITADGPKVVEFNVRLGDPETQVLLPLLDSDPLELMQACAQGTLDSKSVRIKDLFAVAVVLASSGYPNSYAKGDRINIPGNLPSDVDVIHAGTRLDESGDLVSSGGRVLGVVATAENLSWAVERAYAICEAIEYRSKYFRHDIGWRQMRRENGTSSPDGVGP